MISLALARALRDGGLRWDPAPGDRFVVADRDMDAEVFTLAEMTVEVQQTPEMLPAGATRADGPVLAFNGTTEWALDAVHAGDCVWLPSEGQLRERLAGTFRSLERAEDGSWRVRTAVAGREELVTDECAAEAYGRALLLLLRSLTD